MIPESLRASGDYALLRIVFENLLRNAWKYTRRTAHPVIEVGTVKDTDPVTYFVRDNGAGFDMKSSQKLFVPFQRLHSEREFPGTGIGLAIVHRIVSRHGGRIWAQGEVGKGAVFYFTLSPGLPSGPPSKVR